MENWKRHAFRPIVEIKNFFSTVWNLYVLVTTANNPDIMMPAYNLSWLYCILFVSFLVICLYLFMSIILAVIYNNYKKHLKNEVQKYVYRKRKKLGTLRQWQWSNKRRTGDFLPGTYGHIINPTNTIVWHIFHVN